MTTFKKIYNPDKDPRNPIVEIGIEIHSKAHHEYEYGHLTPIITKVIFGKIRRSDYSTETLHKLMEAQGYSPNSFCIASVWECQDDTNIF